MTGNIKQQTTIEILINDIKISSDIANVITELTVVQSLQKPQQCKIHLSLSKEHYEKQFRSLVEQSRLEVKIGDDKQHIFSGVITSMAYRYGAGREFSVQITAHDHLFLLSLTHPVKSFVDVTLVDIAQDMLSSYGITVAAEDPGPLWKNLVQFQSSNLEFLQELSERCGLYFYLQDRVLSFVRLAVDDMPVSLEYGSSLLEVEVNRNHISFDAETTVSGWDPLRTKLFMQDSLQHSSENNIILSNDELLATHQTSIVDQPAQSEKQLESLAQAQTSRIMSMQNHVAGLAEGNINLHPGTDIKMNGLLTDENNHQYRLTRVSHSINPFSGYVSRFSSQPPGLFQRSKSTLVTYGIVSQIADPDASGRVKVTLPTYNNIETNWLEVLIPGAGNSKGLIALPAIEDKVLILMLHERTEQAIVLGGLYGEDGLPEEIIIDGEVSRYSLLTPGGQGLRLDDHEESINLINKSESRFELKRETAIMSTKSGNYLAMDDENIMLNAQVPLVIQAPGNTITIRADKINFEKA